MVRRTILTAVCQRVVTGHSGQPVADPTGGARGHGPQSS